MTVNRPVKVAVVHPDGRVENKELDFAGCQKEVGGFVQLVKLAPDVWAYVNEDGKAMGLPDNPKATMFCHLCGPNIAASDHIVGPMIVCGANGDQAVTLRALTALATIKVV